MKLNKSEKIEKCAESEKSGRIVPEVLKNVYMDVETKKLVATDGLKLVALEFTPDEGDTSGLIPTNVLKTARKNKIMSISANGNIKDNINGIQYERPQGNYPKWQMVIPPLDRESIKIMINPSQLMDIAEALGSPEFLTLEIGKNDVKKPIRLTKRSGESFGLLMPVIR